MKIAVGVLGATGAVGQRFVQLLEGHPWFEVTDVAASDRSAGKSYAEACTWRLGGSPPPDVAKLTVKTTDGPFEARLLFSGLDSSVAGEVETALARKGHAVVSNSRNHRMDDDVPLLIPEINADHLAAIEAQRRKTGGYIVTNPNCSVVGLAMALAPLHRAFELQSAAVVTLQALSGAGYPGVASMDVADNVIPYIGGGEEEKIESEPRKILGRFAAGAFRFADFKVSVSVHRVAVSDGHTMAIFVHTKKKPDVEQAKKLLAEFRGEPQSLKLPFAPERPIHVLDGVDRPQPRLDRDRERGMAVSVGRVRDDSQFDLKLEALVHNTIRGAAGVAILNGELLKARGLLVIVMKFGGTSVGSAERIKGVAKIVRERLPRGPVVVVSAFSHVTDALIRGAGLAETGDAGHAAVTAELCERHSAVVRDLIGDAATRARLLAHVDSILLELATLYTGVHALSELTPRSLDAISAMGERLSFEIVAAALAERGVPARAIDARAIIRTDESFSRAQPQMDEIAARALASVPIVEQGAVPVLGGYIGSTAKGVTTTLGRGGSDWTASLLGGALAVEEIQIWTDVDGMMTVDPRLVPSARVIPWVSFDEAAELAYFGAKVLHPATIKPAIERGIPVVILNTMNPESAGTRITADAAATLGEPRAIAAKQGITLLTIAQPRMLMAHGFLARVFAVFEKHRTSVDLIATSEVSVSLTVDDVSSLSAIRADLSPLGDVEVRQQMAIVSVVGRGFTRRSGLAARIFSALSDVNVVMISFGASDVNVSFVVAEADAERAVKSLHRDFFE